MPRPLMRHSIGELEELFAGGRFDAKVLKQLEYELQFRQVPRAVALLTKVQAAIGDGVVPHQAQEQPAPPPVRAPASATALQQPDLWVRPDAPPIVAPRPTALGRAAPTTIKLPVVPPAVARASAARTAMSLDDAYKILKVKPGATWDDLPPFLGPPATW